MEHLRSILGNFKQLFSILETSNSFNSTWVIYYHLLFFLLLMLFRSVCHQVSNQTNRWISSSGDYILLSANVSHTYSSGLLQGSVGQHAAQRGHAFNWDYAHVLHRVNNYHKRIFLESLYIILKTNTVNDESATFPPIYYNVLKHEWSLSVIYPTLSLSSYWPPLRLEIHQLSQHSFTHLFAIFHLFCSLFYPIAYDI